MVQKKILAKTNVCPKIFFGSNKFGGKKNLFEKFVGPETNLVRKKFQSEKNFMSEKNLCLKKILRPKIKFTSKNSFGI